jgi:hypothetical protein
MAQSQAVTIAVDDTTRVSGLLQMPPGARIYYVLAHGAGAGMAHPFAAGVADGLAERSITTMRYQFPYMELGSKRPDAPKLAQATDDLASPSRLTLARRPRASLPRLSSSSRGTAVGRACNSPVRGEDSDAVFARNSRRSRR